jgi:hypothetical protein
MKKRTPSGMRYSMKEKKDFAKSGRRNGAG